MFNSTKALSESLLFTIQNLSLFQETTRVKFAILTIKPEKLAEFTELTLDQLKVLLSVPVKNFLSVSLAL